MSTRRWAAAWALGLTAVAIAGAASADTLHLQCRVREMRGGAHRELLRRIDIDLQAKTARFSDNAGHGWQSKGEHPIVSVDASRIVLDAAGGKQSSLDRVTGRYELQNRNDGVTMRGECRKAEAERPRF